MSEACRLCPRACGIDRERGVGYCGADALPNVARIMLHQWEEPCISGERGAGTIFFCGCNLNCVFCQNYTINHSLIGERMDVAALTDAMMALQDAGAHTIDLVTPTPHLNTIIPALEQAKQQGMTLPVVYNTNAYETLASLSRLEGLIDVYLPDFKYVSTQIAKKYSDCADYFRYAAPALDEMFRQVGLLQTDEQGIARRGLIVRHLVLPGAVAETRRTLDYLAEHFPVEITLSLMGQYVPFHRAAEFPPLGRKLLQREYDRAIDYCITLGFKNVLIQDLSAAEKDYTPAF